MTISLIVINNDYKTYNLLYLAHLENFQGPTMGGGGGMVGGWVKPKLYTTFVDVS